MSSERYVGERRALWHFLSELQPLVIASLGEDALLRHRIDHALKIGDLDALRGARQMFHHHPEELKRRLMRGLFEGSTTPDAGALAWQNPGARPVTPPETERTKTALTIRFDAVPAARDEDVALSAELQEERASPAPVRVMIRPGTLPSSAGETLRRIADWIERDRRLLSVRHWARRSERDDRGSGGSLDLA